MFLILVKVRTLENNYFLLHTKLGHLWYSVFSNVPINHIQEKEKQKEIWLQKKKNVLLFQLLFNCNTGKTKIMIFYSFVSWAYIYFSQKHVFLISFIYEYTSRSWTDKSEILGKLS